MYRLHTPRRPLGGAVCLLSFVLLASVPAAAQEDPAGAFAEVIDVRVVNLEVVVTDKQGNRVSDLDASDFRLLVDGEETPISFFSEVAEGQVRPNAGGGPAAVPSLEQGQEVGTNYLVFIDDLFAIGRNRDRVIDRIERDLTQLGPRDQVAIVSFSGKALDLETAWTRSEQEIRNAFRSAKRRKAFGLQRQSELRTNDLDRSERRAMQNRINTFIEDGGGARSDPDAFVTRLDPVELQYATRLTTQIESTVLAAVSALRSFANPPGRKVMLLLSGGWPFSPAQYTVNDAGSQIQLIASGLRDPSLDSTDNELFSPLVDTANLLGYTIYPVDLPGLNREIADATLSIGPDPSSDVLFQGARQAREINVHASLRHIAEATGGRPWINSQRDHALEETVRDTRSYYWLGFSPPRQEDDERHDIEVLLVGHPDLIVRTRDSFVDLSRSTEVTMIVESSLLFGNPPSIKPLGVEFSRPRRAGLGRMKIPLTLRIPLDEIAILPAGDQFAGSVEVRVTVMDKEGGRSETPVDRIPITGAAAPRPGQYYTYETELTMRRREHRIVVAVYDPLSGTILSSSGEVGPR